MKRVILGITTAAAIVVLQGSAAHAGVVLSETQTTASANGKETQDRTVYVQGNKQKIESPWLQVITDLDKGIVYIVDPSRREYIQSPLEAMSAPMRDRDIDREVHLKKTGERQVVANQPCDEYSGGTAGDKLTQVTLNACVSRNAPGAHEVAGFEDRLLAQLQKNAKSSPPTNQESGLVLVRESLITLRLPNRSGKGQRAALLAEKTEVNSISVKPLAANTFTPPNDFDNVTQPHQPLTQLHQPLTTPDHGAPSSLSTRAG